MEWPIGAGLWAMRTRRRPVTVAPTTPARIAWHPGRSARGPAPETVTARSLDRPHPGPLAARPWPDTLPNYAHTISVILNWGMLLILGIRLFYVSRHVYLSIHSILIGMSICLYIQSSSPCPSYSGMDPADPRFSIISNLPRMVKMATLSLKMAPRGMF